MSKMLLIGIDIGGTQIKGVLTTPKGEIVEEAVVDTEDVEGTDTSNLWKASVKNLINQLEELARGPVSAIGVSLPGTVNADNTAVLSCGTKMLGIENFVWQDYLEKKVSVINDAHAALFAESRLGAGQEFRDIVMLTLGTGVGGGIMIGGQILKGQMGRAGHVGHISVNKDWVQSIVRTPGSLENSIGECTLAQRSYGHYTSTKKLVEDYKAGKTFASWIWLNSVQALSRGIVSLVNVLSPELVILGGGISKAGDALMNPLNAFLDVYEWRPHDFCTPVLFAEMSNHAGAIGAALFSYEQSKKE